MGFNGAGTFNLKYNWQNDALNGLNISSFRMEDQEQDIANGLSNCLTRDGQSVPTANIPMGNFRLINLGTPVAPTDATTMAWVQAQIASVAPYGAGFPTVSSVDAICLLDKTKVTQAFALGWGGINDGGGGPYALDTNDTTSGAYFTGSISGNTLTVTAVANGALAVGQRITGNGIASRTYITALGTGSGGVGTYTVNLAQTVGSTTMSGDNGGTYLVARDGGRWKLLLTGPVSVRQFGAKGDNSTDDTIPIQNCLNDSAGQWFVPEGNFKYTTLTIPQVVGFCFFGIGPTSKLIQTGAGIKFPSMTNYCFDSHGTIRDLGFDGTSGTANTLDTSFCQTLDLLNLSFFNVPTGFTSLKLDGNPNGGGTYMHDVRVKNLRIYHSVAAVGNAGVALGAWASDSSIDGFIMNGNFTVNYCLTAVANAQTIKVSNSHPYNAKINVVRLNGNNGNFQWDECTFDNSLSDVFYQAGSINGLFTNCFFEAVNSGQRGIVFDNSYNNIMFNTSFTAPVGGGVACVQEINGSSGNKVIGGTVDNSSNWTNLFNLSGTGSFAKGFQQYGNYDTVYCLTGTAQTPQAQNTATNYGANGAGPITNTAWAVPLPGRLLFATVFVDNTPAAGQNFTFNLQKNGTTIASGVINNGSYSTTLTPSPQNPVNAGDQISIQSVFSLTSGSASPRYGVTLIG